MLSLRFARTPGRALLHSFPKWGKGMAGRQELLPLCCIPNLNWSPNIAFKWRNTPPPRTGCCNTAPGSVVGSGIRCKCRLSLIRAFRQTWTSSTLESSQKVGGGVLKMAVEPEWVEGGRGGIAGGGSKKVPFASGGGAGLAGP